MVVRTEDKTFEKMLLPARFPVTLTLLAVVEPRVEDPVTSKLAAVSVPEIVDEAAERPLVTAAFP